MENKTRVGLFFGSFNPVHIGHLAIANYMVEFAGLDKIWFVVSPQNPLKINSELLSGDERLVMLKIAIADDSRFEVCNIEFDMPKPSYTIDTLKILSSRYPQFCFFPIIGGDNYQLFSKWKDYETIMTRYNIKVYPRYGYARETLYPNGNFEWVDAPLLELSASFIRQAIAEHHDVRYFMPHGVAEYICKNNLYRCDSMNVL